MNKIAIVVQRYSKDINGGAELHARLLAEHLSSLYEIDVLTSCAKDYINWENYYKKGRETINGVTVIRFESEIKNKKTSHKLSRYLHKNLKYSNIRCNLSNFLLLTLRKIRYRQRKNHNQIFNQWINEQGPLCKGLVEYIRVHKDKYKAFIFFTYLYYPTFIGIKEAADKSILIPTAHDEPPFYFSGFNELFSHPQFIMYNTLSEKNLVERTYPQSKNILSDIAGVGFEKPLIETNYGKKPIIDYKYFVYIGRIDKNKGCKELINYFENFKKYEKNNIKLIMIGNNYMNDIGNSPDIIYTGFIDEQEKLHYLQGCEALIIPSLFESLSMVTLEAMSMGKPVLANGACEVLKMHIEASEAGFVYYEEKDFYYQLSNIVKMSNAEKETITNNGISYVGKNYQWSTIIDKFNKAIEYIAH